MNLKEYQEFCDFTAGKMQGDREKQIMIWGLGVAGEAGDVAGCIKKTYGHDNDQTSGIKENLGDTLWYITEICNFYGWTLQEVIDENVTKLKKRYPEGFDKARIKRKSRVDWNEK